MRLRAAQAGFGALVRAGGKALAPAGRRRVLAATRGLKPVDAAALNAIPAERLAVYHDLLVGGHQTMLRYALGATLDGLEALRRARPKLLPRASCVELVEAFLVASGGPRTHSLRELATTFAAFLRRRAARGFAAAPVLGDLLRYERAALDVELEEDGPGRFATEADFKRLREGTLDRLLRTRVVVPAYAKLLAFRTDVPAALGLLADGPDGVRVDGPAFGGAAHVVLVREPASLAPRRHVVDGALLRDLRAMKVATPFRLEELLRRRAGRGPRGETEEAAAARVAGEALDLLRTGVLLLL